MNENTVKYFVRNVFKRENLRDKLYLQEENMHLLQEGNKYLQNTLIFKFYKHICVINFRCKPSNKL